MMIEFRNPKHNNFGGIDMEISHPTEGWLPFTASPNDVEPLGKSLWEEAKDMATPADPPPSLPGLTRVYKADIWRRATDVEAEQIDAMLNALPVRLRRLWADAAFLDKTDELFSMIQTAATAAFGENRAAELLSFTE